MATATLPNAADTHDVFPINGTDYVEFYVGNAKQAAHYYQATFGFQFVGYRGPETGVRDRVSYLVTQNKIRFVLTSALGPDGPVADHVRAHGDGVRDIALWVDHERDLTVVDQVTAIPQRRGLDRNDRRCRHGSFPSASVEFPRCRSPRVSEQPNLRTSNPIIPLGVYMSQL